MAIPSATSVASYFFYGTLCDADVRRAVLGRAARLLHGRPAQLPGYRPVYAPGRSYPVLAAAPQGAAQGVLVAGITVPMRRALRRFEGADYVEVELAVMCEGESVTACVFMPRITPSGGRVWTLAAWQRGGKRGFLEKLATAPIAR